MRIALPLLLTLAACDAAPQEGFETYDPGAALPVSAELPMEPVMATARQEPWTHPGGKVLVGFTAPQGGRWTWPGVEPGLLAGDAACEALGADHVCSLAELALAEEAGDLRDAPVGLSFWANDEDAGPGARCGNTGSHARGASYTYEGADASWSGYARTVPEQGRTGLSFHVPPEVQWDDACLKDLEVCDRFVPSGYNCNAVRAIPCCRG